MLNLKKQAAAVGEAGGVLVGELGGKPVCVRYVGKVGEWEYRSEFEKLFSRAALKIGWKRDRRCKIGFRKVAE